MKRPKITIQVTRTVRVPGRPTVRKTVRRTV